MRVRAGACACARARAPFLNETRKFQASNYRNVPVALGESYFYIFQINEVKLVFCSSCMHVIKEMVHDLACFIELSMYLRSWKSAKNIKYIRSCSRPSSRAILQLFSQPRSKGTRLPISLPSHASITFLIFVMLAEVFNKPVFIFVDNMVW